MEQVINNGRSEKNYKNRLKNIDKKEKCSTIVTVRGIPSNQG